MSSSTTNLSELNSGVTPSSVAWHSTPRPSQVSGGQLFFEFDAPEAFISPQLFAVNPRGDMIYSVKIEMRLTLDPDTQEVVVILANRLICRCSIRTGKNSNFVIDNDITSDELRQSSDFYLLADSIAVLLTYNPENYHFCQYVLVLNETTEKAMLTMKRTVTLSAVNSGLTVGMGLLDEGLVMVTGYTGPEGVNRQVVAHLIAADPLKASVLPNKDITPMIRQFERFLVKHDAELHIFASGVLAEKNGLIFLLRSSEYDLFETTVVGRASFKPTGNMVQCELIPLDNTSVLKVITVLLRFVLWMRRVDRGVSLYLYMRMLRWMYGYAPSMIPVTAPPPTFNMYGLDMKSLKFKRVPIKPKLYSSENSFVSYPLAIDCDRSGGVVTAELGSSLRINYFPSQNTPLSLCKLAEHSVYRNYPAFEKSPLVRRSVGRLNWELL